MNTDWLSLHIFSNQYPVKMLTDSIDPLTKRLLDQGMIDKFFFIRYWLGGVHVRLRLAITEGVDRNEVKRLAEAELGAFLEENPSRFEMDPELDMKNQKMLAESEYGDSEMEIVLYPNNSIHEIPYEREWARYAGPEGMIVSEDQFYYSSQMALKLLPGVNWHMRKVLLGQAFQLMLVNTHAFRLTPEEQVIFYRQYAKFWIGFNDPQKRIPYEQRLELLEGQYSKNSSKYVKQVEKLLGGLQGDRKRRDDDVSVWWFRQNEKIYHRLAALSEAEKLIVPEWQHSGLNAYHHLLLSYQHMTNNRLGAVPMDEAYLGFLCQRVVEDYYGIGDRHVEI